MKIEIFYPFSSHLLYLRGGSKLKILIANLNFPPQETHLLILYPLQGRTFLTVALFHNF